jgi:hypothetical protein
VHGLYQALQGYLTHKKRPPPPSATTGPLGHVQGSRGVEGRQVAAGGGAGARARRRHRQRTLHPTPENPQHHTHNLKPHTLNPKLCTPNPEPYTLNPEPHTLNSKPSRCRGLTSCLRARSCTVLGALQSNPWRPVLSPDEREGGGGGRQVAAGGGAGARARRQHRQRTLHTTTHTLNPQHHIFNPSVRLYRRLCLCACANLG